MRRAILPELARLILVLGLVSLAACGRGSPVQSSKTSNPPDACQVAVHWDKVVLVSKTTPTLQVVVSPLMARNSPIHNRVFDALRNLGADHVRYVPWLPYPKLGVAELEPPASGKTSWDFSLIDPFAEDFAQATQGHSTIWNFSTIPQWMFKTPKPVPYPSNPDQVTWDYEQGTEFRDASLKEVADYYARLVSWYTKGGFTDEYGKRHPSGHHYKINYWEVLNEVNGEHHMTAKTYTAVYDAIVTAIHAVDPGIKFVGMAYAGTDPHFFEYFLDHNHHKPGTPMEMISYHFYAGPAADEDPDAWQYTFWEQADHFLDVVRYVQLVRQRLSPQTATDTDELGAILPNDNVTPRGPIPNFYWNLCSSLYAYLYGNLARLGVDGVGESALAQLPGFFPSVTMLDWNTGQPNARYWTLKLLIDNFGPGDRLVDTHVNLPDVYAQGFVTRGGKRKLLLVNKRDRSFEVSISGASSGTEDYVDQTTGSQPPASAHLSGNKLALHGFGVAVVALQ